MKRLSFGRFTFVPTGKPQQIGARTPRRGLADVEEYGEAKSITLVVGQNTLVVGQNKGLEPQNKAGKCARKPKKFTPSAIDAAFIDIREAQVSRKDVGATRIAGKGWYQGKPEASVSYEVAFIPSEHETTFEAFKANMNRASEKLAEAFCQDSVLILRDDGEKRTVAAAKWKPTKK